MKRIALEKVKPEELPLVAAMAAVIWQDYYPPIIGQAQTDYMLEKIYDVKAMQDSIQEKGETYYWIMEGHDREGFVAVSPRHDGILSINKLYVLPGRHGKGIGSAVLPLIEDLYPWFRELQLTVNRKNVQAINFYFRNGFHIDRAEDFDIGSGFFMEDFVMKREFVQNAE
jgi:diamine N-acetyltransferase